jgi:hypothetical protein
MRITLRSYSEKLLTQKTAPRTGAVSEFTPASNSVMTITLPPLFFVALTPMLGPLLR